MEHFWNIPSQSITVQLHSTCQTNDNMKRNEMIWVHDTAVRLFLTHRLIVNVRRSVNAERSGMFPIRLLPQRERSCSDVNDPRTVVKVPSHWFSCSNRYCILDHDEIGASLNVPFSFWLLDKSRNVNWLRIESSLNGRSPPTWLLDKSSLVTTRFWHSIPYHEQTLSLLIQPSSLTHVSSLVSVGSGIGFPTLWKGARFGCVA